MTPDTQPTHPYPLGPHVHILARHPAGLLALDKPPGILSHPNTPADQAHCLINAPYQPKSEFYHLPDGTHLHLLHRIDAPTSGIVLIATNESLASQIRALFRRHALVKVYHALVKGPPPIPPRGTWRDRIARHHTPRGTLRATLSTQGHASVTHYHTLGTHSTPSTPQPLTLTHLRLTPETGRTHQLRIQCAARQHPILGDKTYGDFPLNRRIEKATRHTRLYLHAAALTLEFYWEGKPHTFHVESPLPHSFATLMDARSRHR
jgi:23S rRNA-/tRNA-specific pseudouridylate synthase